MSHSGIPSMPTSKISTLLFRVMVRFYLQNRLSPAPVTISDLQIMETNGVLENLLKMLSSASINILGKRVALFPSYLFFIVKCRRYGGYGQPSWGYGVRNLVFDTPDPNANVETWIRLQEGETRARVILDDQYGR